MRAPPALLLALATAGCASQAGPQPELAWPQPGSGAVIELVPAAPVAAWPQERGSAVAALTERYRALPESAYRARRQALAALVDLERSEALPLLVEVAWRPLPPLFGHDDDEQEVRAREEEIQRTAVVGMARLRRHDGRNCDSSLAALRRVARAHPSLHLQVAALAEWQGLAARGVTPRP